MKLTLDIPETDLVVISEYLNSRDQSECTSSQHEAIAHGALEKIVCQFAFWRREAGSSSPAAEAVFNRARSNYIPRTHRLPPSQRTAGPGHAS